MKLLKTQLFIYIHWIVFFIPFSIWMYIEFFVGTANTNIDNICYPMSIILLATIAARVVICSIYEEISRERNNMGNTNNAEESVLEYLSNHFTDEEMLEIVGEEECGHPDNW